MWAGDGSSIENSGTIASHADTSGNQATAYGVLLQGTTLKNSGTIDSIASSFNAYRSTSYGVRHFSFDKDLLLLNSGTIKSKATSLNGWAYGVSAIVVKLIQNYGDIEVEASSKASGIVSDGQRYKDSTVENYKDISAKSSKDAYGIYSYYANIINKGSILSESTEENGESFGIFANESKGYYGDIDRTVVNSSDGNITAKSKTGSHGIYSLGVNTIINKGTINATISSNGEAFGAYIDSTDKFINEGIISAKSEASAIDEEDQIYGLVSLNSQIYNNGTIIGDTQLENSFLGGDGTLKGDLSMLSSRFNPGNSIGTVNIDGNYGQDKDSKLIIELGKTSSDRLIVTKDILLEDGATLEIIPLEYIKNQTYSSFIQSSSIDGAFKIESPLVLMAC